MILLIKLLLAHLAADFIFQPEGWVSFALALAISLLTLALLESPAFLN